MTREEAVKAVTKNLFHDGAGGVVTETVFIDILIALGVLKLDEPPSPRRQLADALYFGGVIGEVCGADGLFFTGKLSLAGANRILDFIEQQGFKVVKA